MANNGNDRMFHLTMGFDELILTEAGLVGIDVLAIKKIVTKKNYVRKIEEFKNELIKEMSEYFEG